MKKTLALLLALLLLPGVGLGETVVTSFYPIWLLALDLTRGLDDVSVRNLAAPDTGCLHDYQLQTGDMKVLAEADVFLINGAGMESYLDRVFSAFPSLPVISASEGIPLLRGDGVTEIGEPEQEEEVNAHIWLSAANAARMAENLAAGLIEHLPEHAASLNTNLEELKKRLLALDETLRAGLADCPRREIVTFHEAFPYFAQAYGLTVAAVVNREPGETLSPSQMARLADWIRSHGNPPLFVEPQYEDLSARILAEETGAPVYKLDPVVTGPESEIPADYYESVMLENMRVLRLALGADGAAETN